MSNIILRECFVICIHFDELHYLYIDASFLDNLYTFWWVVLYPHKKPFYFQYLHLCILLKLLDVVLNRWWLFCTYRNRWRNRMTVMKKTCSGHWSFCDSFQHWLYNPTGHSWADQFYIILQSSHFVVQCA